MSEDSERVPAPAWLVALRNRASDTTLARLIELLAVVPVIFMVLEVARSGKLQWLDYWYVAIRTFNPDGSIEFGGLFTWQNEHPLVIPQLLYYLDAHLADGDNRVLGFLVVAIAVGCVLLLRAALPKSLPPVVRAAVVVAASALLFSMHGLHLFVRSMSGSAWLTANLFVLLSLLLATRGKWWSAWVVGFVASATYGTSFAVWPALFVVAVMNGERWWRRLTPLGIGFVVVLIWWIMKPHVWAGGTPANDLGSFLFMLLSTIGHLFTADNAGIAVVAGAAILVLYGALLTVASARRRELRFWWGLALYAVLACGMISLARIDFGAEFGLSSRYSSQAALVTLPLLVLLAAVLYRNLRRNAAQLAVAVVGAGMVGYTLGLPSASDIRLSIEQHPLEGVAMVAGYGDSLGEVLPREVHLNERLKQMQHYPFNGSFSIGCDGPELGSRLDLSDAEQLGEPGSRTPVEPVGVVEHVDPRGEASIITGWSTGGAPGVRNPDPEQVVCTMVVDDGGVVTGAGVSNLTREDITNRHWGLVSVGFKVIGPVEEGTRVVVKYDSGALRWMPVDTQ